MKTTRYLRTAADIAVGYASDETGRGVLYAAISTGTANSTLRLPFFGTPAPALEGRDAGYAAVGTLVDHLKRRGFGRIRLRLADVRVAAELSGRASPPKALTMAYVRVRCVLNGLGAVRLETGDASDIRDLTMRAQAEVGLNVAA